MWIQLATGAAQKRAVHEQKTKCSDLHTRVKAQTLQINANGPGEEVFDTTVKKISSHHIVAQQLAAVQDGITERILKTLGSDYKHIFNTKISALNHLLSKQSCFWHSSWKDWKSVWAFLATALKILQIWAQLCIDLTAATVWTEHRLEGAVTSQGYKRWRNHLLIWSGPDLWQDCPALKNWFDDKHVDMNIWSEHLHPPQGL